jgi:hypothetical protein
MTPLERVEALYNELVAHYHGAQDAQVRAAAKLLLVAIAELKRNGGADFGRIVYEYVALAEHDPERFDRILRASRSDVGAQPPDDDVLLC